MILPKGKKIYFTSDHHFGIPDRASSLKREQRFIRWLNEITPDCHELYIMGDLFDFWFEYKQVVPRGYALLFGKLASMVEQGITIHYYRGNHDMWAFNYFEKELGFKMHRTPEIKTINEKQFYLAHGDGLGSGDLGYKFIKRVFENRINQWLFRQIHPDLSFRIALFWSRRSRYANIAREAKEQSEGRYEQQDWMKTERLPAFAINQYSLNPNLNYFIFGHWHLPVHLNLSPTCDYYNIGDWITFFSYLEFDGEKLLQKKFEG